MDEFYADGYGTSMDETTDASLHDEAENPYSLSIKPTCYMCVKFF